MPGPLLALARKARKRAWLPAGVLLAVLAAFVIVMTILQPPTTDQLGSYALNIGFLFALLVAFGVLMQYLASRGVQRFAPLASRIQEVDMPLRGLAFQLDDGLHVLSAGSGVFLTMFFDADAIPLHPRLDEALHWTGARRLKMVKVVRTGFGPATARVDLEALRDRLGAGFCLAAISRPRVPSVQTSGPTWVASVNVFRLVGGPRVEKIAAQLNDLESFLQRFLEASTAGRGGFSGEPATSLTEGLAAAGSRRTSGFPGWRMALSVIAIGALPALLAAAFVWPDLAIVFLTVGIVFIFAVALIGARDMGLGKSQIPESVPGIRYLVAATAVSVFALTVAFETTVLSFSLPLALLDAVFWTAVITVGTAAGLRKYLSTRGT